MMSYVKRRKTTIRFKIKDHNNNVWSVDVDMYKFRVLTENIPHIIRQCAISIAIEYVLRK